MKTMKEERMAREMLRVTLTRSPIKATKNQKAAIKGLGLRKRNSTRVLLDKPDIKGMIRKVSHLVITEELPD
jgi:large subunit ribosomal protein L30